MQKFVLAAVAIAVLAVPVRAQEIVVTGARRTAAVQQISGVGIKRRADFAVVNVRIYGDTRDRDARRKEILDTVRAAIELGASGRIALAYGGEVIQPLTLANYRDKLKFEKDDDRDDAEEVAFFVKTPLEGDNALAAIDRLTAFVKAVPKIGRALMEETGEPGVSIVNPSQYRAQIIAAIAADANAAARAFGEGYVAEAGQLTQPVRWALLGPTEVLLYIEHDLRVVPRR
ncbi:TonB-dependent receptor [Sphingomonas sp.]|uniref:TonB-dependent receptor n=1 Tax=Sphingomonas sp. TaxID=28214 RepID=UPI001D4AE64B|nr:TonB-dependent receptor [Sphingomonas sp.]MBX9797393.1 TonB-dependent receptor [Sphingomonas sp.]